MAVTYIDLVNRLRDRFNESRLTSVNWNTVVGFDQLTKDAINYAYHDILNAEMRWPFLHQNGILVTTPGLQFYNYIPIPPAGLNASIKEVDWDSFFIYSNENEFVIIREQHTIPAAAPFTIATTNATWATDLGITYLVPLVDKYNHAKFNQGYLYDKSIFTLTAVTGAPLAHEYSIHNGVYAFSADDAGKVVEISYIYVVQNTTNPPPITAIFLPYITFDYWRQRHLLNDLNSIPSDYAKPAYVFKSQNYNQISITPVPDLVYNIGFEYWLDANDMVNTTDVPIIPSHFNQVIIDGASKYCYEFREDAQLSQLADQRFKAGVYRMRIELINRDEAMLTGMYWYRLGYTSNTWSM